MIAVISVIIIFETTRLLALSAAFGASSAHGVRSSLTPPRSWKTRLWEGVNAFGYAILFSRCSQRRTCFGLRKSGAGLRLGLVPRVMHQNNEKSRSSASMMSGRSHSASLRLPWRGISQSRLPIRVQVSATRASSLRAPRGANMRVAGFATFILQKRLVQQDVHANKLATNTRARSCSCWREIKRTCRRSR